MIKPATISLTSEAGRGYWGESLCLLSSQRVKRTRRTGWAQRKIVGKNSIFVDSVGHHVHSYSINLVCESSWLYGLRMLDTKCLFGNWALARGQRKANTACRRRLLAHGGRRGGWEPKVNMRTGEGKSLQPIWRSNKSKLQHPLLHILSFLPHFGILSCRDSRRIRNISSISSIIMECFRSSGNSVCSGVLGPLGLIAHTVQRRTQARVLINYSFVLPGFIRICAYFCGATECH